MSCWWWGWIAVAGELPKSMLTRVAEADCGCWMEAGLMKSHVLMLALLLLCLSPSHHSSTSLSLHRHHRLYVAAEATPVQDLSHTSHLPNHNPATPHHFRCPITCTVMEDPVIALDGYTYERAAISTWLEQNETSPLTGERCVCVWGGVGGASI